MLRPAVNQLLKNNESVYSLVCGIAKRARQITDEYAEEKKIMEEKPVKLAVDEYAANAFRIVPCPNSDDE